MKKWNLLFLCLWSLVAVSLSAQTGTIEGKVLDNSGDPIEGVDVRIDERPLRATTQMDGTYRIENVPNGNFSLVFSKVQYKLYRLSVNVKSTGVTKAETVELVQEDGINMLSSEDLIPSITLSEAEVNDGGGNSNVSGLLTSSRDIFFNTAAFAFGPMRFSIRGYDSENTRVYMNGIEMNSAENGRAVWSLWGGLNDALRNRTNTVGLGAMDYSIGGIGGATQMDIRASSQWKQFRAGLAYSNRSYRYRPMFIYSTGLMKSGWAFSASGSLRYAEQGQVPGTYYSAGSYYLAAEKRFGDKHALNLIAFGAPRVRGSNAPIISEMQEIAREAYGRPGYFYNPYWGYQTQPDGSQKVRNQRVAQTHTPVFMLTHDFFINKDSKLMTSLSYQHGRYGSSALNWFNAADPRPEYYRKWPSYYQDNPEVANALRQQLISDPTQLQINWDQFYEVNRGSYDDEFSSSETRAKYIVEERRYDHKDFSFNTIYRSFIGDAVTLNGGIRGNYYIGHTFKVLEDLLGADYYIDIDQFALRDSAQNPNFYQNNLDNPNEEIAVGDKFGYDFNSHIQKAAVWGQMQYRTGKMEFFGATEISATQFWRDGNLRNGRFPDNSLGKGEVSQFINYNVKGGATYKIDGRNYLFANGTVGTRAPYFRDAYVANRFRDQLVNGLRSTNVLGGEVGYILSSPKAKARVAGYYTAFLNDFYNRSFFSDNATTNEDGTVQAGFINFIMTNVDRRHMGLELAFQYEVYTGLKLHAVAAIGEHVYTSRPDISIYLDNDPNTEVASRTAYIKNLYVAGSPQMAYNVGLNYRAPKFWFVNINVNYLMRNFVDFNPDRRTLEAVSLTNNPQYTLQTIEQGSQQWEDILQQEELPHTFTVDLFAGKSFRIESKNGKRSFIYINVGINNILNNRNIITGGFEQLRFNFEENDPSTFPNRYFYGYGTNIFASLTYRLPM